MQLKATIPASVQHLVLCLNASSIVSPYPKLACAENRLDSM